MKLNTKVLVVSVCATMFSFNLFAKAPSPEKIKEYMKVSGSSEIVAEQAKSAAEAQLKDQPKKKLKTLTKEQTERIEKFVAESINMVLTEEELDKILSLL